MVTSFFVLLLLLLLLLLLSSFNAATAVVAAPSGAYPDGGNLYTKDDNKPEVANMNRLFG